MIRLSRQFINSLSAIVCLLMLVSASAGQVCTPHWDREIGMPGLSNDAVRALAVFDDGSGPRLHAGGGFESAGGVNVNGIARWDGSTWSALSMPSGIGIDGDTPSQVRALAVFDDGSGPSLYVGGNFSTAGGLTVNNIARWDGLNWSALTGPSPFPVGTGVAGEVHALAVFDDGAGPALFAGGTFISAGGITVNRIAKWDGVAWSGVSGPSGTGVSGGTSTTVRSLSVFNDGTGEALYVGGSFSTAGGIHVNRIARWDGTVWQALIGPSGTGMTGGTAVYAMTTFDDGNGPALFVGGDFGFAGGVVVSRIARWNATAWAALTGPGGTGVGGGVSPAVTSLQAFDDGHGPLLYAGGSFTTAGGWGGNQTTPANHVVRWNGLNWLPLTEAGINGVGSTTMSFAVFDDGAGPSLYLGGYFSTAGGLASHRISSWRACRYGPGDVNCDGQINSLDVLAFVTAIIDTDAYTSDYPGCDRRQADLNCDGQVNGIDVDAFVSGWLQADFSTCP